MQLRKSLHKKAINSVRSAPLNSGIQFQKFGKSLDINYYSDSEIIEMLQGIYTSSEMLLTDGDYFINLNDVTEVICVLDKVSYNSQPTSKNYLNNSHNRINNIRTFYVQDYFLVTKNEVANTTKHKITNLLFRLGAIMPGRNNFLGLFSIKNDYKSLHFFTQGYFSKDLYHPIKQSINRLFFKDDYFLSNFKVESQIIIERKIR